MNLKEICVRPVYPSEESLYQELMQKHHYLGALRKIGETIWYIGTLQEHWVALVSFSAPAWKCGARDQWIGWNARYQFDRLKLLTNNSRFLILPQWHVPNLASRVLSLCQRRLPGDWQKTFGHPLLLLETFVDPRFFQGTVYKAANWIYVGNTKGYQRIRNGYTAKAQSPKMVFVKPLQADAQMLLSRAIVQPDYRTGGSKMMLTAEQTRSLPWIFLGIPDPRRSHGIRHRLPTVLSIAAGATLCGMTGYRAIAGWAKALSQKARQRFGCRFENGRYVVPSEYVIRDVLVRVDPAAVDRALQNWNNTYAEDDDTLAIDGKTMCNAIDDQGNQAHIMSAVGHQTKSCYTQKKVGDIPTDDGEEMKRTNEIKVAAPLLDAIAIQGKEISADALLTQRDFAEYLVKERGAHYHFTVKGNQAGLYKDIELYFQDRQDPDYVEPSSLEHGRITTRRIWTTTELNEYLDFPYVKQAFVVERCSIDKKTGKESCDLAYGITSRPPEQADAKQILSVNRGHWSIESCHYIIDWNFDEDRSRIRTGHGPENVTRLRRFAVSIIKSKKVESVAQRMRDLNKNIRAVFDYLKMTKNSCQKTAA